MRKTWARRRGGMKSGTSNLMPFAPFDGLPPLHKLDQRMMRSLRKLADQTGWTVERCMREAIADFVAKHVAEEGLETKIIDFRETRL
jgi:hypothetical protein